MSAKTRHPKQIPELLAAIEHLVRQVADAYGPAAPMLLLIRLPGRADVSLSSAGCDCSKCRLRMAHVAADWAAGRQPESSVKIPLVDRAAAS